MAKILLHDIGHGHAKTRGEILRRQGSLLPGVLQQLNNAVRKPLRVSRRIEFDGQLFALRHLPEVRQISADNRHSISAGQMRNPAASRGRRVGHDRNRGALKQIGQRLLWNVAAELDAGISRTLSPDRFRVACGLGMISAGNH
jgi:hypothetical protein